MDVVEVDFDSGTGNDFPAGTVFPQLKHFCLQLLQLHQNPNFTASSTSVPSQFLQLLRQSPPHALQPFFDYALFPLLLLLDAAADCRAASELPLRVSDVVAEGVIECLEELLRKCTLGSVDQIVVLLKKLSRCAMLSPTEASEEFRVGVVKCFKALLLRLEHCSEESCSCKRMDIMSEPLHDSVLILDSGGEQCLLAFLQSESASVAIGHWLHLLLKTADVEAARGHRGSSAMRVEAFATLRVLIAKVGNADALAFFLPGVISQIGKVLQMSKVMTSGAAGSSESLYQAIMSLAEFLAVVMLDDLYQPFQNGFVKREEKSLVSLVDELRNLPSKMQNPADNLSEVANKVDLKYAKGKGGSLRVSRTKDWIVNSSTHINKLLSATFPYLVVNPSTKVRQGMLSAIEALLLKCKYTLVDSRLMLLECTCILACDDSGELSSPAQMFLKDLFSSDRETVEHDFALIYSRIIEKLPQVVLGNDEAVALSHAQKLLTVIYFSGPKFLAAHLLHSPVAAARFLDVLAICLSQNTVFAGSLDSIVVAKPSSAGFLHSIAEMEATRNARRESSDHKGTKYLPYLHNESPREYELPGIPPWFDRQKLYQALAGILRLVGLSLFAESGSEASPSLIMDIPLGFIRKLIAEIRTRECSMESWESWYSRTGSGHVVRQASTAVCILNEMIYGLSDKAIGSFTTMFQHSSLKKQTTGYDASAESRASKHEQIIPDYTSWNPSRDNYAKNYLIDCVGSILHEYISPEVWTLPLGRTQSVMQSNNDGEPLNLHFFQDNAVLHQEVIEGIGVFTICLGKEFSSNGFLHSSLFMLLENLVCSNSKVKSASDAVLQTIAATLDYPTVGHLVLANSDYVIDSICRQLRHLELNPHMPNVLAAMLSYIGIAHQILPLLEEPMRAVSSELEILGRHQHPDLTVPFLKAVMQISKASNNEARNLPSQAEILHNDIKPRLLDIEKNDQSSRSSAVDMNIDTADSDTGVYSNYIGGEMQEWEPVLTKLSEFRRYRRIVGSIAGSCIIAATPNLASSEQTASLIALDVIEDSMVALSGVEEAYKHEKNTRETLDQIFDFHSLHMLRETLAAAEDEAGENRLLPAMNKIWPFLIACVQNKNPVVVRRCSQTIKKVVEICGGDFFARRFQTDGDHFWKLLSTSPFQRKPISKEAKTSLQLLYHKPSSSSAEDGVAELSALKVQAAVLNMIAGIARNKKSASALEVVLKKVSGLVVGIACSRVTGLREAAMSALSGLARLDPDLIWLLIADIYFTLKKDLPSPPSEEFAEISEILPPPLPLKGYLYVEYGGQSFGFDIDTSAVEHVFKFLHAQVFTAPGGDVVVV